MKRIGHFRHGKPNEKQSKEETTRREEEGRGMTKD
jgi:hypothetical protein